MTQQSPIEIAKAWVSAYNAKNWSALGDISAGDITYDEVGTRRVIHGSSDYVAAAKVWASAFPDSRATFGETHQSGDTVILELTWRGSHTGPLPTPSGAIPATGKPIDIKACLVATVAGSKVRSARHYFDMMTMLSQLGVAGAGV